MDWPTSSEELILRPLRCSYTYINIKLIVVSDTCQIQNLASHILVLHEYDVVYVAVITYSSAYEMSNRLDFMINL